MFVIKVSMKIILHLKLTIVSLPYWDKLNSFIFFICILKMSSIAIDVFSRTFNICLHYTISSFVVILCRASLINLVPIIDLQLIISQQKTEKEDILIFYNCSIGVNDGVYCNKKVYILLVVFMYLRIIFINELKKLSIIIIIAEAFLFKVLSIHQFTILRNMTNKYLNWDYYGLMHQYNLRLTWLLKYEKEFL